MKLMADVTPNPHLQPRLTTTNAISGTPITLENLAAESKIAVALARSHLGNQWPVALETTGNEGASATPRSIRAAKIPAKPPATAVTADARVQRSEPQRPTRVAPMRSTTRPTGIWR